MWFKFWDWTEIDIAVIELQEGDNEIVFEKKAGLGNDVGNGLNFDYIFLLCAYQTLFSDIFGATSVELLQTYTSPDVIAELDTELFTRFLKSVSHGRFGKSKVEEIQNVAKNTFSSFLFADSATLAIRQFIQQIKLLEEQIAELENFISEKFASFDCKLDTITGVGTTLAASFFAEIGDITRFESPDKLAAFAGIDPSVKQSREFNGTRNKMSKRGSPYLRRTFWLAAVSGIRSNPALKAIYDKKRAQGKHHAVAVSAVMHKLCNIVFAILKTTSLTKSFFLNNFFSIRLTFHSWSYYCFKIRNIGRRQSFYRSRPRRRRKTLSRCPFGQPLSRQASG